MIAAIGSILPLQNVFYISVQSWWKCRMPCPAHHRVFLIDAKMYLFYVIAFVLTVHKFKQFIDNRLEKLPVSPAEKIHNVMTKMLVHVY